MSYSLKGGIPFIRRVPAGQTDPVSFPSETMSVVVTGAEGTKIYFSKAEYALGKNYVMLTSTGIWQANVRCISLFVDGSGEVEVVGLCLSR